MFDNNLTLASTFLTYFLLFFFCFPFLPFSPQLVVNIATYSLRSATGTLIPLSSTLQCLRASSNPASNQISRAWWLPCCPFPQHDLEERLRPNQHPPHLRRLHCQRMLPSHPPLHHHCRHPQALWHALLFSLVEQQRPLTLSLDCSHPALPASTTT